MAFIPTNFTYSYLPLNQLHSEAEIFLPMNSSCGDLKAHQQLRLMGVNKTIFMGETSFTFYILELFTVACNDYHRKIELKVI
ncbi:hypothetical protein KIN20_005838 [Parelaphostrongylus tenuis]|uniref:Uncharacterized protein n=1 Tax=Parelaphostrongylus tenuis TaxID=148309 RepID=A0AAD5M2R2_PARTN|nr:hypothetical protein KIN20_005838 [Parelaphostrongylus tenuis]